MSKTYSPRLTGFENDGADADAIHGYPQALATLRDQGFCIYGQYPWDFWETRALARGASRELAGLGRAVMREAHQHQWQSLLQKLCGWEDEGEAMIALALAAPDRARFFWEKLLETDGCRGAYHPQTGEWLSWI